MTIAGEVAVHNELINAFTDYEAHFDQHADERNVYKTFLALTNLHQPDENWPHSCQGCPSIYPCSTIRLIRREMLGKP